MADPVDEGQQKVEPPVTEPVVDKDGKHPESVPWTQYVGVKEMLTKSEKSEGELKQKVSDLEEQSKKAVSTEQHEGIKKELTDAKTELQKVTDQVASDKAKSLTEKRDILVKKGNISEEDAKGMSEEQVDGAIRVLANIKPPAPDLDGGGSATTPSKSKEKMQSGFAALHPEGK